MMSFFILILSFGISFPLYGVSLKNAKGSENAKYVENTKGLKNSKSTKSKSAKSESPKGKKNQAFNGFNGKGQVTFMAFNVENLFDHKKDKNKNDHSFLPLKEKQNKTHKKVCSRLRKKKWKDQCLYWDWSEKTVKNKIKKLVKVILQANPRHGGQGPDVVMLAEVENAHVLQMFNQALGKNAYPYKAFIEGSDKRGIDTALLSRLPIKGSATLHSIHVSKKKKKGKGKGKGKRREKKKGEKELRGILHATLILPDGELLDFFAVHLPSPYNPLAWRKAVIQKLNSLQKGLPKGRFSMAGGDFNIIASEEKQHRLYAVELGQQWLVSHRIGCRKCKGTYFYPVDKSWSFLDALLFSKNMTPKGKGKWRVLPSSIVIGNALTLQKSSKGYPLSFEPSKNQGVSDHWPVMATLQKASSVSTVQEGQKTKEVQKVQQTPKANK